MAKYIYPAVFHPNDDGSFTITYPDLPGCISEGKSLENAMYMAQDALKQWLEVALEHEMPFSTASEVNAVPHDGAEFVSLICAEIRDARAVRRTVSLPKWLDDQAAVSGLSLSRVLQDALKERLNVN